MEFLMPGVIFLTAVVIAVPLFTRFKLGSILGYLVAGIIIGPSALALIHEPDQILHFAELGVVLLLFVIGLELEPKTLWRMRTDIFVTGSGQLLISAIAITGLVYFLLQTDIKASLVTGLALALSSTAFAIQLMTEKGILRTPAGQKGFAILLMQDLAVIPILLLVEGLAGISNPDSPDWWVGLLVVTAVLLSGRYLLNPLLGLLSRYGSPEVMTASALLIVIATAMAMQVVGLSMGMGAFLAGILLANSSFRHQLEVEIAPFKGLLLGLFFIAIGMNLDITLLAQKPGFIVLMSLGLIALKTAIIFTLLVAGKHEKRKALQLGLMLSQGGEFAFVIMALAASTGVLEVPFANQITLIVGISMALTSPLAILFEKLLFRQTPPPDYDHQIELDKPQVIIAGFGRFGQITGRILAANRIPFTALDNNAEHIEFISKFGSKIFYGDATSIKLLKAAGIEHAKVMFIAADSDKHGFDIAKAVKQHYPDIKIIARAKSRFSVLRYQDLGVHASVREMFEGSLAAAKLVLEEYGFDSYHAEQMVTLFRIHDEDMLAKAGQSERKYDLQETIKLTNQGRAELESLFRQDIED